MYPHSLNIDSITVTLLVFNKLIFVIASSAVHISLDPIKENRLCESLFANISSLLPIWTFKAPFSLLVSYQAIIDLSCIAETSHAVLSTYSPVIVLYTVSGIFVSNVTFSMFSLSIVLWLKNLLIGPMSDPTLLKVL